MDCLLLLTRRHRPFSVLYVDEAESVKRQLNRGQEIIRANKMVGAASAGCAHCQGVVA